MLMIWYMNVFLNHISFCAIYFCHQEEWSFSL